MEHKIDIDHLHEDILEYYGTAMFNDFAMDAMNVQFIEMASDQDLIAICKKILSTMNIEKSIPAITSTEKGSDSGKVVL